MCEDRFDIHIYPSLESRPRVLYAGSPLPLRWFFLSILRKKWWEGFPGNLSEKQLVGLSTRGG